MPSSLYTTATALSVLLLPIASSTNASARHGNQLAFIVPHSQLHRSPLSLQLSSSTATAVDEIPSDAALDTAESGGGDPESVLQSRNRLIALSKTLADNSPSGRFITRPSDKIKLQNAINDLEATASDDQPSELSRDMLLGDWTLIATANLPSSDIRRRFNKKDEDNENNDEKGGWFKKNNKKKRSGLSLFGSDGQTLNPIQKSIQKTIEVTQRIRNDYTEDNNEINRVDNVIEYTPLDTLESILPESSPLSSILGNVNVNPLGVKKSKVVLVHKAEVESVKPVLRTKIAWVSSVLNVAGTSQFLEPDGADVFGLNNLFGDFINVGTFDTPYVDEDIRISRTSGPVLEQLRVFVKKGSAILDDEGMMSSLTAELRVEEEKEVSASTNNESDDVGTQVKKVVEAADDVREAVTSMAENARSTIEKDMEDVTSALSDTMDDVAAKVQDAVEGDLEEIGKAVENVQSAIQDGNGMEDIGEALTNVTKAVVKVPEDVRSIVEEDATELGDKVEEALDGMVADVQDAVEEDLKDVSKSIEGVRDAAVGSEEEEEKKDE